MIRQLSAFDRPALLTEPEIMPQDQAFRRLSSPLGSSRLVLTCEDNVALYFERARPWTLTEAEDLCALFNQDVAGWVNRDGHKEAYRRVGAVAHRFEPINMRMVAA